MLEIGVLRSPAAAAGLADSTAIIAKARAAAQEKYAHPALARIGAEGWDAIGTVLTRLRAALAPLTDMPDEAPLPQWAQAHFSALAALARDETGEPALEGADAAALAAVFEDFTAGADTGLAFSLADYAAFFDRVSAEAVVREPLRRHPRLAILGLLEARLVDADVVLLGGLDETVWPPQARGDAFLNRPLRAELGLSAPERRIGQTAHDFVQALGHERVILSRALKRGRAPTVASRFLQRMGALAGEAEWSAVTARGARLLALAQEIDRPEHESVAVTRPKPCPPLALRPRGLSVTRIETLRRDPYSIYARHILRLLPLEPLGAGVSARDYGNWLHEALAQFGRAFPKGPLPVNAEEKLFALAQASFAPIAGDPEFVTFKWPQIRAGLMKYLGWERGRRPGLARLAVETRGEISISLADGSLFKLSANADRIELGAAGEAHIFDYKTGALPSAREISAGFSPQLSLEGAILLQQGFSELPHVEPLGEIAFVKFGGGDIFTTRSIASKNTVLSVLVEDQFAELIDLLNQFREPETVYASRPFPQFLARYSDYDHLARVLEWSVGAEEEAS